MKKRNSNIRSIILSMALIILVAGCGDDDEESTSSTSGLETRPERGIFAAELKGVNTSVAGNTTGAIEISVNDDEVSVNVQMNGAPIATHAQHIHIGTACATAANDTNADGIVDAVEANNVSGKILIPLDDDLNTQDAGKDVYPVGPIYVYSKSSSYAQMISDLTATDPDPSDDVGKLSAGTPQIGFEGKVVEIHGVPPTTNLPNTVASANPTRSPHEELPIACGVLSKKL